MTENWITTEDAVEISGYNPDYLRTLIRTERIQAKKFGRVWQVNRASLINYLDHAKETTDARYGSKPKQ